MKKDCRVLHRVAALFSTAILWACTGDASHTPVAQAPVAQLQTPTKQSKPKIPTAKQLAAGKRTITVGSLPAVGKRVYRAIWQGGPFAYDKDGTTFFNRERLLPKHPRGYYREYTVAAPRARSRGAKRIVCGGPKKTPTVCYYTADHYASFLTIIP